MTANIVVGLIFFIIVALGAMHSLRKMKNNSCPGCSGGCTVERQKSCKH